MAGEIKRATRVAEGLRQEIATLLGRKVRDPRVSGVVVSRVVLTDDLRNAKVYVRLLDGDAARREESIAGLTRAAGMLRREATRALKLRVAPELRFFYDEGEDARERIERVLDEIKRDDDRG